MNRAVNTAKYLCCLVYECFVIRDAIKILQKKKTNLFLKSSTNAISILCHFGASFWCIRLPSHITCQRIIQPVIGLRCISELNSLISNISEKNGRKNKQKHQPYSSNALRYVFLGLCMCDCGYLIHIISQYLFSGPI